MRSGIAAGVKEPAAARRCEAARTGQKKSRAMGEGQKKALFSSGPSCREDGVPWNSATNHERLLGHARAHVSSPDLVTHIAQHDAGLRARRRPVVMRRCVGLRTRRREPKKRKQFSRRQLECSREEPHNVENVCTESIGLAISGHHHLILPAEPRRHPTGRVDANTRHARAQGGSIVID